MAHEYTVTHCKGSILNGGLPTNVAADNLHLRDGFFFFTKSLGSMQGEYNVFCRSGDKCGEHRHL